MAAAGIGTGFGAGYATGALLLWTLAGALLGVGAGILLRNRATNQPAVITGQRRR